ncbi:MAG TPA: hypothetical protein V6C57_16320 [Coleofasciculaceae cyanobacterium]
MQNITFVCCVESGSLEDPTVRLVQSLRLYGGKFAEAPVVAVTPRWGLPLSRQTLQRFEQLQVEHLSLRSPMRYSWNNFMNKPLAILAVDERVKTEAIGWLDSDMVVVGEPDGLTLAGDESFLACTADAIGATQGQGDPLEPYWQAIADTLGLDLEQLPWVTTAEEQLRVRFYFNAGLFVYRRETAFAKCYLDHCSQILDARLSSKLCGFFFTDQIALGLTAAKLGLPWRSLPYSYNYSLCSQIYPQWYDPQKMRNAKIIHYHDGMWNPFWSTFLRCMQDTHPQVADWLAAQGALSNKAPYAYRLLGRGLKEYRKQQSVAYGKTCQVL